MLRPHQRRRWPGIPGSESQRARRESSARPLRERRLRLCQEARIVVDDGPPHRAIELSHYRAIGSVDRTERKLCSRRPNPKPIAVRVRQVYFTSPGLLDDLTVKLAGYRVDVTHADVDERVRLGISSVFRQEEPRCAVSCNGDEGGKVRLESVLPLLLVTKALVPGNGTLRIGDPQNRYGLVHTAIMPALERYCHDTPVSVNHSRARSSLLMAYPRVGHRNAEVVGDVVPRLLREVLQRWRGSTIDGNTEGKALERGHDIRC